MNKHNGFKVAALAASIALAMSATSAMAAAPTATQLPGKGKITGTATVNNAGTSFSGGVLDIDVNGVAVIDWGKGTGDEGNGNVNSTGVAGFNIGSDASVTFTGVTGVGTDAVLNIDSSGNVSQIFGELVANNASVFVANGNGVIVGKTGYITGNVGLIANTLSPTAAADFAAGTEVEYSGSGGDVTVQAGADLAGTILISGGGTVNLDVGAIDGDITVSAGLPSGTAGSFATTNDKAMVNLSGEGVVLGFSSAGDATNSGDIDLISANVAGTFTNTGTLTLAGGFAIDGAFVNEKSAETDGEASFGSFTNDGEFDTSGTVATTDGGLTNNGQLSLNRDDVSVNGGDFVNNGQMDAAEGVGVTDGNFTNKGSITLSGDNAEISVEGGNFDNAGSIVSVQDGEGPYNDFHVEVNEGSITNSGELDGFNFLRTYSNPDDEAFTAGADYSIANTGSISSSGSDGLQIHANTDENQRGDDNDSTGSFTNTGVLDVGSGENLTIYAFNDLTLGGSITVDGKAMSATNPLYYPDVEAETGVLTLSTPLVSNDETYLVGGQVKITADVTDVAQDGSIWVDSAPIDGSDYDIRIANGVTLSAHEVGVDGYDEQDHPNVILQGTLEGNLIYFGYDDDGIDYAVNDVFTGPNGGLVAKGDNPQIYMDFTGRLKAAPYLNDGNFRYNGLPISMADAVTSDGEPNAVSLYLDPAAFETNGTSNGLSAVNLLINGSVVLHQDEYGPEASVEAGDTAVTGVTNIPNTHLVVQSTGNISTDGDFYWPGYVYLGTIAANADGSAAPGTLGLGQITLGGDFNNVLPGDVSGASGVHFISQFPLGMDNGDGGFYSVTTNANAWVNFGTDLLTQGYATGTLGGSFYGGTKATGTVVNYGDLDPTMFHTHAPVATK